MASSTRATSPSSPKALLTIGLTTCAAAAALLSLTALDASVAEATNLPSNWSTRARSSFETLVKTAEHVALMPVSFL